MTFVSQARITGVGVALPDGVVTNDDIAARGVDTNHDWIFERTGIAERRVGGSTSGLAAEASLKAMAAAGVDPASIDMLILATTSPDRRVPASASTVQELIGASCGAMDVNAACSGWAYGLVAAHGMIAMGHDRILVAGSETLSRITDPLDRTTCILFADGAGAAVVERTEPGRGDLLGWDVASDGSLEDALFCEFGGMIEMKGKDIFRNAVLAMERSARRSLEMAGYTADDVDVVVPHQANVRIVDASCRRLGIPYEKCAMVIQHTGNTSSATIPLALNEGISSGKINDGDLVLIVGFGAGMSSASAVLRWGGQ